MRRRQSAKTRGSEPALATDIAAVPVVFERGLSRGAKEEKSGEEGTDGVRERKRERENNVVVLGTVKNVVEYAILVCTVSSAGFCSVVLTVPGPGGVGLAYVVEPTSIVCRAGSICW